MALEAAATTAAVSATIKVAIKIALPRIVKFFEARKVENLVSKFYTQLISIRSLADDAEPKQFTDPRFRDWLLEVKDVLLDAADLIDDIQNLSKSPVDAESESQTFTGSSLKRAIKSRMRKIFKKLISLSSQHSQLNLRSNKELPQTSETTSFVGTDIYGRDDDKKKILEWLISDNNNHKRPSILSIVGMGGLGKTTLVQHVFNDPRVDEAKFDVKAWVWVSDKFDVLEVSKRIFEAVHVTKSNVHSDHLETVHQRLKDELNEKKYLLVLDNLWNEDKVKWENLHKPLMFGAQGSRILVTTRSGEVAKTMGSAQYLLKQLQNQDCLKLFNKYALGGDDDTGLSQEREKIRLEIVQKSKGLPIVLKTAGELLHEKSFVPWKTVFENEILGFSNKRCDIIPDLAWSYIHLSSNLKTCFAYCALFPKDYEFKKEYLMHLWMTENLLHYPQEEVCQQYFNDLLSRSFFQHSGENEELFVMHNLLNDLAKYVGKDIYFRLEAGQTDKIQKVTRHVSVELRNNQYFDGFETLCNTKRLRTFMPIGLHIDMSIGSLQINMSKHDFSKFKFLRFLSLSRFNIEEVPDSIGNFKHLRSLDLSYTPIKKLSEKICSLSRLQILKLNYCGALEELPSNLHLLTNLCRLELIENNVKSMPSDLKTGIILN